MAAKEFILNRSANLQKSGHNIRFEKGQPTWVPPELFRDAIAMGAEPLEGDKNDMLPAEEAPEEQLSEADREALIFGAFDEIMEKNDPKDFGADSKPSVAAVVQIVKFSIVKKELIALFQKYREQKTAEV
jgi:hypothetical protein